MHDLELRELVVDDAAVARRIDIEQRGVDERAAALRVRDQEVRRSLVERQGSGVVDHLLAVGQGHAEPIAACGEKAEGSRGGVRDIADAGRRVVERSARRRHVDVESFAAVRGIGHAQQELAAAGIRRRVRDLLRDRRGRCPVDQIRRRRVVGKEDRAIDDRRCPAGDADLDFPIARIDVLVAREPFERQPAQHCVVADRDVDRTTFDEGVEETDMRRLRDDEAAAFHIAAGQDDREQNQGQRQQAGQSESRVAHEAHCVSMA